MFKKNNPITYHYWIFLLEKVVYIMVIEYDEDKNNMKWIFINKKRIYENTIRVFIYLDVFLAFFHLPSFQFQ